MGSPPPPPLSPAARLVWRVVLGVLSLPLLGVGVKAVIDLVAIARGTLVDPAGPLVIAGVGGVLAVLGVVAALASLVWMRAQLDEDTRARARAAATAVAADNGGCIAVADLAAAARLSQTHARQFLRDLVRDRAVAEQRTDDGGAVFVLARTLTERDGATPPTSPGAR